MSDRVLAVAFTACAALGCLGDRTRAQGTAQSTTLPIRPLGLLLRAQAAHNEDTFFLRARWSSAGEQMQLSVALSRDSGFAAVRDFERAGCFLACHDRGTGMPNWLPSDGSVPMSLFPGFGGFADAWTFERDPDLPKGQADDLVLFPSGLVSDTTVVRDGGVGRIDVAGALARTGDEWDVTLSRKLATGDALDVELSSGQSYHVGVALHDAGLLERHHYVSLPVRLAFDGEGGIEAAGFQGQAPAFSDEATFPVHTIPVFLPGITSFEFLVGAIVDRQGEVRPNDFRHGGASAVAEGTHGCGDCHQVRSEDPQPAFEQAGALQRLALRRGGAVGPTLLEPSP